MNTKNISLIACYIIISSSILYLIFLYGIPAIGLLMNMNKTDSFVFFGFSKESIIYVPIILSLTGFFIIRSITKKK